MSNEVIVVLTLIGLGLLYVYRQLVLELLIVCALFGGLGLIWSADSPPVWLKGTLTVLLMAGLGLLADRLGLRPGERGRTGRRGRGTPAVTSGCNRCGGSGSVYCSACNGTGEGPGGTGSVLGQSKPCFHCHGRGRVPCGCGC